MAQVFKSGPILGYQGNPHHLAIPTTGILTDDEHNRVSDLILRNPRRWNIPVLHLPFSTETITNVLKVHPSRTCFFFLMLLAGLANGVVNGLA